MRREELRQRQERSDGRRQDRRAGPSPREHPALRWVLLDGGRPTIAALVSAGIFLAIFGLALAGAIGLSDPDLVTAVFGAAITGVFTLVTITISINQLILSRVLGSPEKIRDRTRSVQQFRSNVEGMAPRVSVSPTEPLAFLWIVLGALRDRAVDLRATYRDRHASRLVRDVDDLADALVILTDDIESGLADERTRLFRILSPILDDRYSEYRNTLRRVEAETADLSDAEGRAIDDLRDALDEVSRTRHYFKTLYIHMELASVSRLLLVTGVPAVVVSFAAILVQDGELALLADETMRAALLSAALTVASLPLVVLLAYGLRLATIAKRTATFGAFVPVEEMP